MPHLGQLLLDLLRGPLDVGPVEADARGAILKAMRAVQRRQPGGQSLLDAAAALLRLHRFPALPLDGLLAFRRIEVRVAGAHLRDQRLRDVVQVERPTLLRHDGVEQHL